MKSSHAFVEKGSKDPRTRGFKNGIKYCRRCRTRKKYQTGNTITIEINRSKLTPESYGHGKTPGQRVFKGPAKLKKTRRQQTKQRNTSNNISDKNGTCTSQLMRMHEIKTGFISSSPTQTSVAYGYWEQKGLTSALTDQGPYEFAVSGAGDNYIDLANTYLFVEAHIMDDDDTALDGERTLDLSTYGCIPSLVMSVLA